MTIKELLKLLVSKVDLIAAIHDVIAYAYGKFKINAAAIEALDASLAAVAKSGAASDVSISDITGFTPASANVQAAIAELFSKINAADITVEQTAENLAAGILSQTVIKKNGTAIATINIPKDFVNNILGLVTITEGTDENAGKFFDGVTEVGAADGVTSAGVYLKSKQTPKAGSAEDTFKYADVSGLIEYVTSGSQAGDMVFVTIDPVTHKVTATITDGTITKAKLVQALQDEITSASKILEVANIKGLTNAQCEALRAGDIVVKIDNTGKNAYKVSYKGSAGLCLTYADCENVETVAYNKTNEDWAWDSTDVTPISTALQPSDFATIGATEASAIVAAAIAEVEAEDEEQQSGGE